jgi:hypothetical protein
MLEVTLTADERVIEAGGAPVKGMATTGSTSGRRYI